MNGSAKISVVLPTYNRAATLPRAIHSVLAQGVEELELIVVDDGSTDDTRQVVAGISDSRLRYEARANGGPAAARNTGLAAATGEWVCFQDSDDEWLPGKLAKQMGGMRDNPDAVLGVCGYFRKERKGGPPKYFGASCPLATDDLNRQVLKLFFYTTPTWIARRETLLAAGGFDEDLECWEDWELSLRLSEIGPFTLVDEPLVVQHVTADSVNDRLEARSRSLPQILRRHGEKWTHEPQLLFDLLFDVGRRECLGLSCRTGRRWMWEAARLRPLAARAWVCALAAGLGPLSLRAVMSLSKGLGFDWRTPKVVW